MYQQGMESVKNMMKLINPNSNCCTDNYASYVTVSLTIGFKRMLTENLKMKTWTEAAKVNTKTVNTYSKLSA